jgi:hypothetical protein
MEQKAPVAKRFMIGVAPRRVRADVTIYQPSLALLDVHITVLEINFPVPNRLHFRPRQLRSRLVPVQKVVQMLRLPVDSKVLGSGFGRL